MPKRLIKAAMSTKKTAVKVEGKILQLTNLDKILYPAAGFTKAQVIDYYIRAAPVLLPHLKDRPLTLKRYPEGVEGLHFYEKQCPPHRPGWITTAKTPRESEPRDIDYCVINSLSALVWVTNLADLELHTFLHRSTALDRPTAMVFDLDPGPPADIVSCCRVALWMREILTALGLQSLPKTSGSKGLQLYVPLNTPVTYEQTKALSQAIALRMASDHPQEIVATMTKAVRKGKVFIDWSQNDSHKTTVCVYSLRAKDSPTVSMPVTWDEVESAARKKRPLQFDSEEALRRIEAHGDLFEPVLTLRQKIPEL